MSSTAGEPQLLAQHAAASSCAAVACACTCDRDRHLFFRGASMGPSRRAHASEHAPLDEANRRLRQRVIIFQRYRLLRFSSRLPRLRGAALLIGA
jgi:hypothetical protein